MQKQELATAWAKPGAQAETGGVLRPENAQSHLMFAHALRRRAQRKFRERQKQKLADSEGEATALRRELEKLRLEKSRLETRNGLLEKLVSMKGGGALYMFSDLDTALEAEAAHAKEGSQTVLLTVKKGKVKSLHSL